jgi:beta-lactamase class A
MNPEALVMDPAPSVSSGVHPTRRQFLGTLAACSSALLWGTPPLVSAATGTALQSEVVRQVKRLQAQDMIAADEKTSWTVYDLSTREQLVSINEDIPRQAASMIKPFVAQAYFYTVQDSGGRARYTQEVREIMERSIRRSSNPATNQLIALVSRYNSSRGAADVERVLKRNAPAIFRDTSIMETIPANGRTYLNRASARDYDRFLTALWDDRLPYADELREIMALPNRDRIVSGCDAIPDTVRVYDKTGSTAKLCGNMGIIEARDTRGRSRPYTFVGIIERRTAAKSYGSWIKRRADAIRSVSNLVYSEMKARHGLV